MNTVDWTFLAVGGFLLGAFLSTGWYTTRWEPAVKRGYIATGIGITIAVAISTIVDFTHDVSDWWRGGTLVGYAVIAAGLMLILRERRGERSSDG